MFKNKHITAALLVAPVLALISYFAVDYMVKEKPHAAVEGDAYALVAKSNCRYDSGECTLHNGEFEVTLQLNDRNQLEAAISVPINGALLEDQRAGAVSNGPVNMEQVADDAQSWAVPLVVFESNEGYLRMAFNRNGTVFFAEVPVVFLQQQE